MRRSFSARIKDGVIVPDGMSLPEGTLVTVVVADDTDDSTFDLSEDEADELRRRIAHSDRSGGVSASDLLAHLANAR